MIIWGKVILTKTIAFSWGALAEKTLTLDELDHI